ncbi:hypothetical protein RFI_23065, partial [Reticulomyxa filosa]
MSSEEKKEEEQKSLLLYRFLVISDTHGNHEQLKLPDPSSSTGAVNVLIHCGDFTNFANPEDLQSFNKWLGERKEFKYKICITGNHDNAMHFEMKHKFKVRWDKHLNNATHIATAKPITVTIDNQIQIHCIPYQTATSGKNNDNSHWHIPSGMDLL